MSTTDTIRTVSDVIELWRSTPVGRKRKAAIALAEELGIPATTVRTMKMRNVIARKHWPTLLESARKHALDPDCSPSFRLVTAQLLLDVMSNRPSDSRSVSERVAELAA